MSDDGGVDDGLEYTLASSLCQLSFSRIDCCILNSAVEVLSTSTPRVLINSQTRYRSTSNISILQSNMYIVLLLSSLLATVLGAPLVARQSDTEWKPAAGTTTTCDVNADKYISLTIGPEQGNVIFEHACAGIMPGCAFPENLAEGTVCTQTVTYKLDGPKNTTLNALVEKRENHNKLSDWAVNCEYPLFRAPF
ncbi:hypothetical protein DPSP01_012257 [Paraphaeosphaeria sporulosa]